MNFFQSVTLSQTVTSPYQTITCYAMPWLCLKKHVLHMGLKHASREKITYGKFFDFRSEKYI